jgi:hypothetical protein
MKSHILRLSPQKLFLLITIITISTLYIIHINKASIIISKNVSRLRIKEDDLTDDEIMRAIVEEVTLENLQEKGEREEWAMRVGVGRKEFIHDNNNNNNNNNNNRNNHLRGYYKTEKG